jgi:hypothetical protein
MTRLCTLVFDRDGRVKPGHDGRAAENAERVFPLTPSNPLKSPDSEKEMQIFESKRKLAKARMQTNES